MDMNQRKGFRTMLAILMSRELEQLVFSLHSGKEIVFVHKRISLVVLYHF